MASVIRSGLGACALYLAVVASVAAQPAGYPITPVLFTNVRVADDFWSKRLETNRTVSIPHDLLKCEETGRIRNFDIADSVLTGKIEKGTFCTRYGFDDSDIYKVIEGIAYSLQTHYDAALDARTDELIEKIRRAQEKDGYLYTMRTIDAAKSWAPVRWVNDRMKASHELYNLGHLYEAAVAHYYATGKASLLDIALRSADLLVATFGPEKMHTVPGHQVTELGLVKLYLVTGKKEYLDLADFFVSERGKGDPAGETYNQDLTPILKETQAVGHAVRAGYFYAGVADVAALTSNERYLNVLNKIWDDVISKKLYITGGVGAVGNIEGYGAAYELPNLSAYCETCAGIALVYWNHRMFLQYGEAKYMDVIERVIYNGFLSGVSMSGDRFFYPNPLESLRGADRSPWFTCACCPSNDVRFVPSIPGYQYGQRGNNIYVNLFIGGTAKFALGRDSIELKQTTNYPWSGRVVFTVDVKAPKDMTLRIRIPGWLNDKPLSGDLYAYLTPSKEKVKMFVNGAPQLFGVDRGYAQIPRTWRNGDSLVVEFPMAVRRVVANPKVEDDKGKVAIERGPIVYCIEGVDQPNHKAVDIVIPDTATLSTQFRPDLLGGVQVVTGFGFGSRRDIAGTPALASRRSFTAIPYYAWAHRGRSEMTVWPARELGAARAEPAPTIASRSTTSNSVGADAGAANDQILPKNSGDQGTPKFHWWPKKGTTEWIQYTFAAPTRVSRTAVYWFDDTGSGECRFPKSWRVLYHDGQEWKPVTRASEAGVAKDVMNAITFDAVETDALRLDVTFQDGFSAGLYEWEVKP
jgi:uncharacterized protein